MKQVKLIFRKGGKCHILAHGTFGEGTSEFTLALANALGEITERHIGYHHSHVNAYAEPPKQTIDQKVSNS